MLTRLAILCVLSFNLSGCLSLAVRLSEPQQHTTCKNTHAIRLHLNKFNRNAGKDKATPMMWSSGLCTLNTQQSKASYECGWQLLSPHGAKLYWLKELEEIQRCVSSEWYHRVDVQQQHAFFRDKKGFSIRLWYQDNSKTTQRHQVRLSFQQQ